MRYLVDDRELTVEDFLVLADQVWPGTYDVERTRQALRRTLDLTAYDGDRLVGCLRILSDGCFFGTITELMVSPELQRHGIGSELIRLAKANAPTLLYFGAQPGVEHFYEKNGCQRGMQAYVIPAPSENEVAR